MVPEEGIIVERMNSEMKLSNLRGAGEALKKLQVL
jgi:hypothetical protein